MTWLRSNRWYLVALAVLLPAAFFVALSTDWFRYVENENGRPIEVRGFDSVEYAGATFSMLEHKAITADSDAGVAAGLLPGTSLVSATVRVRPGESAPFCDVELTDTSGERSWPEASFSDADFDTAADAESYCSTDAEEPYKLQVFFVVPDDAAEHPRLELRVLDSQPDFLVFLL